jgi:serine/threonine-protein kinase
MRIGDFELLQVVGKGGMGAVWLARVRRKAGFEKLFAIKTMLGDQATDPHLRSMFLDEARVASRISHPNVVQILDLGEQEDLFFIVMEWVEGDSLQRACRIHHKQTGALCPLDVALRVTADACAGLHAAHELTDADGALLDVVHRDVSPQNILLSTEGVTKIIDFGVARARDRSVETRSGSVKGKLRYMAPEQALGENLDRRADVFGAGAVLYWLLTARAPHEGESDLEILRGIYAQAKHRPIPDSVPEPIAEVLEVCLAPAPEGRYATALDLKQALEHAANRVGAVASTVEVSAFVRTALKEELEERRLRRKKAIARLDDRPASSPDVVATPAGGTTIAATPPSAGARPSDAPTKLESGNDSDVTGTTLGSAAVDASHGRPRTTRTKASLGIASAAVLALIGVGAAVRSRSEIGSEPDVRASASAAITAPTEVAYPTESARPESATIGANAADAAAPGSAPVETRVGAGRKGTLVSRPPPATPRAPAGGRTDAGPRRSGPAPSSDIARALDRPE